MTQINQNIAVPVGDTLGVVVSLQSPAGDDTPPDLTGVQARWSLGRSPKDGSALISRTTQAGTLTVENVGGTWRIRFHLNPADTKLLPPGGYYHDLAIIAGNGDITTIMQGKATLLPALSSRLSIP